MKAKNDNKAKWYVVESKPGSEFLAGGEITALGQTVYVPTMRKEYKHHRQKKWIKKFLPLIRGYVFVLASDHWSRVLDCEHVSRVLRSQYGGEKAQPVAISDVDVQTIRAGQEAGLWDDLRVNRDRLQRGDLVRVNEGAFIGFEGKVDGFNEESATLFISAMCREVRTTIPLEALRQVG
jgi:transcription antitermination factor NusG